MSKFETEFLDSYLKLGLVSMPKTDIVRQSGTRSFQARPREAKQSKTATERKKTFTTVATKFAEGAAKAAGASVLAIVKEQLGLT